MVIPPDGILSNYAQHANYNLEGITNNNSFLGECHGIGVLRIGTLSMKLGSTTYLPKE